MTYPCMQAMITNITTITPDTTVKEAMDIFKEKSIRNVPVVDANGKFVGLFGLQQVLMSLLPKAASMADGLENLAFVEDAAPGVAKRLRKVEDAKVSEMMNTKASSVDCKTSTIQALNVMAKHGSPVVVTDHETEEFKGVISRKSLLDNMYGLLEEIEKDAEANA